jgi:hypothetical protein
MYSQRNAVTNKSVWILLSRHVTSKEEENNDQEADFLTVHIFKY